MQNYIKIGKHSTNGTKIYFETPIKWCNFATQMRNLSVILLTALLTIFSGKAQECALPKLDLGSKWSTPTLPSAVTPVSLTKPIIPPSPGLRMIPELNLTPPSKGVSIDSLGAYIAPEIKLAFNPGQLSMPESYWNDWQESGLIAHVGGGELIGTGAFSRLPGLGDTRSASIALTKTFGDRLTVTAGVTGNKYHFGREAWNDYGIYGNMRYQLNERFALKAFGQYYFNPRYHSMAAMPYIDEASYGATLETKFSNKVSLDVGVQRYYDPYSHTWRTLPILAPTVCVLGQPISMDFGGLVWQLLDNIFHKENSGYRPIAPNGPVPVPLGFNPHSPVPIPDALRR